MGDRKKDENSVPAKIVDLSPDLDPIPAKIVEDRRTSLGKRLGILSIAILLLFFTISSYIQSAKNFSLLRRAAIDRSELIHSVNSLSRSNDKQARLIFKLQKAIKKQNDILEKAGFKTVRIPSINDPSAYIYPREGPSSNPRPTSSPSPQPSSNSPSPKPSSSQSPEPHPTPSQSTMPINKIRNRVCKLTGVCLILLPLFLIF